jgi:hypothetical protein
MTTARFAAGRLAWGTCDRCGFRYHLKELQYEIQDQHFNGLRVCPTCKDEDHPQLRLGEKIITDPEALFDPRPDLNRAQSIGFFGWRPVGHPQTGKMEMSIGTVTVEVT